MVHFQFGEGEPFAIIYRHYDGYALKEDLERFLQDAKNELKDTRFYDPEYLAAKYVVWQANEYAEGGSRLNFTGLGISTEDHGDVEYICKVKCSNSNEEMPEIEEIRL
jgi:hypothetical protein